MCGGTGRVKKTSSTTNNGATGSGSSTTGNGSSSTGSGSSTTGNSSSSTGSSSSTTGSSSGKIDTGIFKPSELTQDDYGSAFEIAGIIVNALTTIGTVIAVIGIMIIGIKYMVGSVEEKAEYKKTMWPYIIGCIFIFAITRIVSIIYSLASQM